MGLDPPNNTNHTDRNFIELESSPIGENLTPEQYLSSCLYPSKNFHSTETLEFELYSLGNTDALVYQDSRLGFGSFSDVFPAHLTSGRECVAKIYHAIDHTMANNEMHTAELLGEHPHIPVFHGCFEIPLCNWSKVGLVFDYIEGITLEGLIKHFQALYRQQTGQGNMLPLPADITQDFIQESRELLAKQIIGAIRAASRAVLHYGENEIVHCDIKPQNIIVPRDPDRTVVIDLSHASSFTEDSKSVQVPLAYAAPEIISNEAINERTDIYSLATILAHTFTEWRLQPETWSPSDFDEPTCILPTALKQRGMSEIISNGANSDIDSRDKPQAFLERLDELVGEKLDEGF